MVDRNEIEFNFKEIKDGMSELNKAFDSRVKPIEGLYGTTIRVKENDIVERITKLGNHHYQKEYYNNRGVLYKIREAIPGKTTTIDCDDFGKPYMQTETIHGDSTPKQIQRSLVPNTTITKGNFISQTDDLGRLILAKVEGVEINNAERSKTTPFKNDNIYRQGDEVGHLIGHIFYGPTGPENLVPQTKNINRSSIRKVECIVQSLTEQGKNVNYEMKCNYVGSSKRPSSFEPQITVDGKEYVLPKELKKIYNEIDINFMGKTITNVGEKCGRAHETGIKSGLLAAGITFAVSTADNISAYIDGEITAEEMATDILKETVTAGGIEYGSELISGTVSSVMSKSSSALIRKVAGSSLPVALVSFAVESYDCITDYAKGVIDGVELTYELGENATSVAGTMKGASIGAKVGLYAGPVGAVAGGIIGGVVGAMIASEIYATAIEMGIEGAEYIAERAEGLMKDTIELYEEYMPERIDEVKEEFENYINQFELPFSLRGCS